MSTMTDPAGEVILGVDTHELEHVAALIDARGRLLGTLAVAADERGFRRWSAGRARTASLRRAGVEGTGSFGVGLTRFLTEHGVEVLEVTRPNRRRRRHLGKSDPVDAEAAARAVLAGEATALPKPREGIVESIRVLQLARRSAIKARTQAGQQIRSLLVTAPTELRPLAALTLREQIERCARLRPGAGADAAAATRARPAQPRPPLPRSRARNPRARTRAGDAHQDGRTTAARPARHRHRDRRQAARARKRQPQRLRSDAALAALCGASPVEASSGKTKRHRLNRGGDRQGNNALWTIANNRLIHHPETRAYAARRQADGLSRKEICRCLKRNLARRLYPLLIADLTDAAGLDLT